MSIKSSNPLELYERVDAEIAPLAPAGPHGQAYIVRHKASQRLCTMRIVQWGDLDAGDLTDTLKSRILAEVKMQATDNHKHLATFVEYFAAKDAIAELFPENKNNAVSSAECMCIVTANEDQTLQSIIAKGEKLDEKRIWKWIHQTTVALGHLHLKGILHGNLSPTSIFVDANDDIKLSDLGVAAVVTREQRIKSDNVASVAYLSPQTIGSGKFDSKSDMWALGCVFYELITLAHPFSVPKRDANAEHVLDDILNNAPHKILKKDHDYSWDLRMLPRWLLQKDPAFRPAALDVYFTVWSNWKDYSQPEDGKTWVDEKSIPWTAIELEDEDTKLVFGCEGHIQSKECTAITWEMVEQRVSMVKVCAETAPKNAPQDIVDTSLAISFQGVSLIAA